jgi:hypothetical protein
MKITIRNFLLEYFNLQRSYGKIDYFVFLISNLPILIVFGTLKLEFLNIKRLKMITFLLEI